MLKNIEELKKERPDLVAEFEAMSKEELLKQCYLECIDAINMEDRVQVFMNKCTINMSKTNYTTESINMLISEKEEQDIRDFCDYLLEDLSITEMVSNIKERSSIIYDEFKS